MMLKGRTLMLCTVTPVLQQQQQVQWVRGGVAGVGGVGLLARGRARLGRRLVVATTCANADHLGCEDRGEGQPGFVHTQLPPCCCSASQEAAVTTHLGVLFAGVAMKSGWCCGGWSGRGGAHSDSTPQAAAVVVDAGAEKRQGL